MHDRFDRRPAAAQSEDDDIFLEEERLVLTGDGKAPEVLPDFNEVLFWTRLAASQSRKSPFRTREEAQILRSMSEHEAMLAEFFRWRDSPYFSEREKAAMELSESITRKTGRKSIDAILRKARSHFNTSEMVQLTLTIRAIKDWLEAHAQTRAHVLIVQEETAEQNLLRKQISESGVECSAVFVQHPQEALELLTGAERQLFRSDLIALVVDVRLPRISGAEILKAVRSVPGLEHLPIVVMTSSTDPRDVEECKRLALESNRETTVEAGSFTAAIGHIFDRTRPSEARAVKVTPKTATGAVRLNTVSQRLREHFQKKKQSSGSAASR